MIIVAFGNSVGHLQRMWNRVGHCHAGSGKFNHRLIVLRVADCHDVVSGQIQLISQGRQGHALAGLLVDQLELEVLTANDSETIAEFLRHVG